MKKIYIVMILLVFTATNILAQEDCKSRALVLIKEEIKISGQLRDNKYSKYKAELEKYKALLESDKQVFFLYQNDSKHKNAPAVFENEDECKKALEDYIRINSSGYKDIDESQNKKIRESTKCIPCGDNDQSSTSSNNNGESFTDKVTRGANEFVGMQNANVGYVRNRKVLLQRAEDKKNKRISSGVQINPELIKWNSGIQTGRETPKNMHITTQQEQPLASTISGLASYYPNMFEKSLLGTGYDIHKSGYDVMKDLAKKSGLDFSGYFSEGEWNLDCEKATSEDIVKWHQNFNRFLKDVYGSDPIYRVFEEFQKELQTELTGGGIKAGAMIIAAGTGAYVGAFYAPEIVAITKPVIESAVEFGSSIAQGVNNGSSMSDLDLYKNARNDAGNKFIGSSIGVVGDKVGSVAGKKVADVAENYYIATQNGATTIRGITSATISGVGEGGYVLLKKGGSGKEAIMTGVKTGALGAAATLSGHGISDTDFRDAVEQTTGTFINLNLNNWQQ